MPSDDVTALLTGGGAPAAKFPEIGTTVSGTILASKVEDQRDIKTGEVKTFQNGDPMKQIVVTLQTHEKVDEDDDGKRRLFIKAGMFSAVRQAIQDAEAPTLEEGGQLTVTHTGLGQPSAKGFSPPKLFTAIYERPDPISQVAASFPGAERAGGYGFDEQPF